MNATTNPALTDGGLAMHASVSIDGNICVVDYKIEKSTAGAVFVLDALPGIVTQGAIHQPDLAWVGWRDPDTVVLFRGTPPLPRRIDVLVQIVPLARRVENGRPLSGRIRLPVPILESNPYFTPAEAQATTNTVAARISLTIEYVAENDGARGEPVAETPGLFRIARAPNLAVPLPFRTLSLTLVPESPIPVGRRTDPGFEPI